MTSHYNLLVSFSWHSILFSHARSVRVVGYFHSVGSVVLHLLADTLTFTGLFHSSMAQNWTKKQSHRYAEKLWTVGTFTFLHHPVEHFGQLDIDMTFFGNLCFVDSFLCQFWAGFASLAKEYFFSASLSNVGPLLLGPLRTQGLLSVLKHNRALQNHKLTVYLYLPFSSPHIQVLDGVCYSLKLVLALF